MSNNRILSHFNEKSSSLEALAAWFQSVSQAFRSFISLVDGLNQGLDGQSVQLTQKYEISTAALESISPFQNSSLSFFKDSQAIQNIQLMTSKIPSDSRKELESLNGINCLIGTLKETE